MSLGALVLLFVGLYVYAFYIEPDRLVVNEYVVNPRSKAGEIPFLKVAIVSDLHAGSAYIDEAKIKSVVELTNQQRPDLILVLGDFVSQKRIPGVPIQKRPLKMEVDKVSRILSGLKAKHGVYSVIGNHDDWYGGKKVRESLEKHGLNVLVDEIVSLDIDKRKLHIFGLRDLLEVKDWRAYNKLLLEKVKEKDLLGEPLLIATHTPDSGAYLSGYPLGIANQVTAVFAGHTHGGQVWFPIVGSQVVPSNFGKKYAYGVIEDKRFPFFVSTGVGTSIMPVRFLVPPEVAVVYLNPNLSE